jgi:hypothetical protein
MLDYVYGHDQIVARFVADLIPHCHRGFGPNIKAMGVVDEEGKLIAGIVYSNYDPEAETIEISGAALPGKYWLTRGTIERMYVYPFLRCGCQMIYQKTPADNERLLVHSCAENVWSRARWCSVRTDIRSMVRQQI